MIIELFLIDKINLYTELYYIVKINMIIEL